MTDPLSPNSPSVNAMIDSLQSAICTHTPRFPFGQSAETVFDIESTRRAMPGPGIFAESIDSGYPAAIEAGGAQQVTPAAILGSLGAEHETASAIGNAFSGNIGALVDAGFSDETARLLIDKVSRLKTRMPESTDGHPTVWFEGFDEETGEMGEIQVSVIFPTKVAQELHARLTDRSKEDEQRPREEKKRTELRHTLAVSVGGAKPQNSGHLAYKRTRSTRFGEYRAFRSRMPSMKQTTDAHMIRRVLASGNMFAVCEVSNKTTSEFLASVEGTWTGSATAFPGMDKRASAAKDYEARHAKKLVEEFVARLEDLSSVLENASPSLHQSISDRLPVLHMQYLSETDERIDGQVSPDLVSQAMKSVTYLLRRVQKFEAEKNGEDPDPFIRPSTLDALRAAFFEVL